jgi:hypothetical protein
MIGRQVLPPARQLHLIDHKGLDGVDALGRNGHSGRNCFRAAALGDHFDVRVGRRIETNVNDRHLPMQEVWLFLRVSGCT